MAAHLNGRPFRPGPDLPSYPDEVELAEPTPVPHHTPEKLSKVSF